MTWFTVVVASVGTFLLKVLGMVVPERVLERDVVKRVAALMPVALLAALIVTQTFATGQQFVLDARAVGLAAAFVALLFRAPFLVVVAVACAATAGVRLLT